MKRFLKSIGDRVVPPIVRYVSNHVPVRPSASTILSELERRISIECADYVQSHMERSVSFPTKAALRDHALTKIAIDGIIVEFGVFRGASINQIASKLQNDIVYGFDSFEGLQEDWAGHDCVKGTFDLGGQLPAVLPNVRLVKGWYDKTIPEFLAQHSEPFAFVHCDCDTYEASKVVFGSIGNRIRKGTIIVFDEYFGFRGWKIGTYKAWQELVSTLKIQYEYLGFTQEQVSIRVTGHD